MPSYRFLYQARRISDAPSSDALQLTGSDAPPEGWEIVPNFRCKMSRRLFNVAQSIASLERGQIGRCGSRSVTSGFTFACARRKVTTQ